MVSEKKFYRIDYIPLTPHPPVIVGGILESLF
jgi:hypothetical protein